MQLHGFLHEYECFPFGSGENHISVITMIQDRVNKYFDEEGNWKIEIFEPNEYLEEDESNRENVDRIKAYLAVNGAKSN